MRLVLYSIVLAGVALAQQQPPKEHANGSTLEFGFEQRVRNENWNNLLDYSDRTDDEREQIRYRTRVWLKAPLSSNIDAFVGLNSETNQKMGKVNQLDEVVFETAYLDFKKLFVPGLTLRVGRQNIMKGEGFLLFEGNPGDGSRSIYFNAVNLGYTRGRSKIELIGILDPRQDRMLPVLNDCHKYLQDWDDQAVGAYFTRAQSKQTNLEAYYFYKKEVHDYLAKTNPQFQPDRHVSTAGMRLVRKVTPYWTLTGEIAKQWGAQHPNTPISAWAGYGYVTRSFNKPSKPYVLSGYWAFSGGDPSDKSRIGDWDPIFSRWPKWSELYIYSQVKEKGVGYWTNTGMWQNEFGLAPTKKIGLRFTHYHMTAFHPFPGSASMFGTGTHRGENLQARADFTFNKSWKGHVLYEEHLAGDFYSQHKNAYFLRFEMTYLFKQTLALHRGQDK